MIFSNEPDQIELEQIMTQPPFCRPRGKYVIKKLLPDKESCNCGYCLYVDRKKKCTLTKCPYIEERITAGSVSRTEGLIESVRGISILLAMTGCSFDVIYKRNPPIFLVNCRTIRYTYIMTIEKMECGFDAGISRTPGGCRMRKYLGSKIDAFSAALCAAEKRAAGGFLTGGETHDSTF